MVQKSVIIGLVIVVIIIILVTVILLWGFCECKGQSGSGSFIKDPTNTGGMCSTNTA